MAPDSYRIIKHLTFYIELFVGRVYRQSLYENVARCRRRLCKESRLADALEGRRAIGLVGLTSID